MTNVYPTKPHGTQPPIIVPGSPLAVAGIFLEVIRERFSAGQETPWTWLPDVTRTELLVEVGYNADLAARGTGRAVYVNRTQTVPAEIVIGNQANQRLPKLIEVFTCMMTSSYSIDCVSSDRGESTLIADTIQFSFIGANQLIEAYFGLHSLGLPVMGATLPYEHDQTKFSTTLSFDVQYQITWRTQKIRPLLQQVVTRVTDSSTGLDAAEHLTQVYLVSASQEWPAPPNQGTVPGSPYVAAPEISTTPATLIPANAIYLPNQRLVGTRDSVNVVFSTAVPFLHTDFVSEVVYTNGVRVDPSRYIVGSTRPDGLFNTITFLTPPLAGDLLVLDAYLIQVAS